MLFTFNKDLKLQVAPESVKPTFYASESAAPDSSQLYKRERQQVSPLGGAITMSDCKMHMHFDLLAERTSTKAKERVGGGERRPQ